jgi:hypothetical protein
MPASTKHDTPQQHGERPSTALPSSQGDSPKRVVPKDISPEFASWNDLKVTDVHGRQSPQAGGRDDVQSGRQAAGSDTATGARADGLPSSCGASPQEVTPMDVEPGDATWNDRTVREAGAGDDATHQQAMVDESSELSFPASDPPALSPEQAHSSAGDTPAEDEAQLDDAIEFTFPASDPIAVSQITRIEVDADAPRR